VNFASFFFLLPVIRIARREPPGRRNIPCIEADPYDRASLIADFDSIRISWQSGKDPLWSHGEVTKPMTITTAPLKPERDAVLRKIFWPVTTGNVSAGNTAHEAPGVICDKCGVESRLASPRERLGHIELASPCSHVWFFKPALAHWLPADISMRDLERNSVLEGYVVIDTGDVPGIKEREMLPEEKYRSSRKFCRTVSPQMGRKPSRNS